MAAYTLAELQAELVKVRTAMTLIMEKGQHYTAGGPGQDMILGRPRYDLLHEREKWLVAEITKLENAGVAGGATNLVQFQRPQ